MAIAAAFFTPSLATLQAQEAGNFPYDEIRTYVDTSGQRVTLSGDFARIIAPLRREMNLLTMAGGNAMNANDKKNVDNYIKTSLVAMTWEDSLPELPKRRDEITKLLRKAGQRDVAPDRHSEMRKIVLESASRLAANQDIHPASRTNMVHLIGELNVTEPDRNGEGTVPMPEALTVLVRIIRDVSQPEYLRVAALRGIDRHARYPFQSTQVRDQVAREMLDLALLDLQNHSAYRSWMRRHAVVALGNMAKVDPQWRMPGLARSLSQLIANRDLDVGTRAAAAISLGAVKGADMTPEEITAAWKGVADFVFQITQDKPIQVPVGDDVAVGDDRVAPYREGMSYYLVAARIGLDGIAAGNVPSEDQEQVTALTDMINKMIDSCGSNMTEAQLAGQLYDQGQDLGRWLDNLDAPPAPAEDEPPGEQRADAGAAVSVNN